MQNPITMTNFVQAIITNVITVFFSFTPLLQLVFGIGAAGISGYIEYEILSSLISNMPYILHFVVIVETMKLILIFNHGKGDQSKFVSSAIRTGFIALSIYCSGLYCLHELDRPEADGFKTEQLNKIEQQSRNEVAQLRNDYASITDRQTAEMNRRLDELFEKREREKKNKIKGTDIYDGKRYQGYTKEIRALQNDINLARAEIRQELNAKIDRVRSRADSLRSLIQKSAKSNIEVGPPVLLASLSVLYGEDNFDDSTINANIILIGLLLTLILELLIYYTFVNLAEEYGGFLLLNMQGLKDKREKEAILEDIEGMQSAQKASLEATIASKFKNLYTRFKNYHDRTMNKIKNFGNTKIKQL